MDVHATSCCGEIATITAEAVTAKPQIQQSTARLECVYCSKSEFKSEAELKLHLSITCRIAKSFLATSAPIKDCSGSRGSNQDDSSSSSSTGVQAFVQGRIRRKGDASALHLATASLLQELNKKYDSNISNNNEEEVLSIAVKPTGLHARSSLLKASAVASKSKAKATPQQLDPLANRTSSTRSNSNVAPTAQPKNTRENSNAIALSITNTSVPQQNRQQQRFNAPATGAARARKASPTVPRKLDKLQPK